MTQSVLSGPWFPFTRGIQVDEFPIYAVNVNGYNVVASTTSSSSSTSSTSSPIPASTTTSTSVPTSSTSTTSTPYTSPSPGLSSGAAAGIGIGAAAAVIIVAILAFFIYRWMRRNGGTQAPEYPSEPVMSQQMDAQKQTPEYYGGAVQTQELPI
jgi:hypothetical protein